MGEKINVNLGSVFYIFASKSCSVLQLYVPEGVSPVGGDERASGFGSVLAF